jgi:anti-sigma regulatory factor (Ser/Thr protein kinase)
MDRAERVFDPSPEAAAAARLFAKTMTSEWGLAPADAVLVVSELATNAVRHARSRFEVCLQRDARSVLIEVTDKSLEAAEVRTPEEGSVSGHGLRIVERIARNWGSRPGPHGGKTVWAELAL